MTFRIRRLVPGLSTRIATTRTAVWLFTWELLEHAACEHRRLDDPVLVKPGGVRFAFCVACNELVKKAG